MTSPLNPSPKPFEKDCLLWINKAIAKDKMCLWVSKTVMKTVCLLWIDEAKANIKNYNPELKRYSCLHTALPPLSKAWKSVFSLGILSKMKYSLSKRGPLEKWILDFLNSMVQKLRSTEKEGVIRKMAQRSKKEGWSRESRQKFTKADYWIAQIPNELIKNEEDPLTK